MLLHIQMYTQPFFDYPVLEERERLICEQCLESSEKVRRMSACLTAVCVDLAKYKPKMLWYEYRIMWLFSHLACKEVYHIIIFICTACLYFAMEIVGEDPGSLHTLS